MTRLHITDLPDEATASMLGACRALSTASAPGAQLEQFSDAELAGLRHVLAAGAGADSDDDLAEWCTNMGRLLIAELYLRTYRQVAIDAKAAAIVDEERRIATGLRMLSGDDR